MVERVRLVVLFGGRSAEHEVSCVTAVSVLGALDPDRYDVVPVGITRQGQWVIADEAARLLPAGEAAALPASLDARGTDVEPFSVIQGEGDDPPIVVFPLLHGPFGEDGTVQGLCELAGVPYVGSGVAGSAVCMDKILTKRLLTEAGLPVAPYLGLRGPNAMAGLRASAVTDSLADRVSGTLGWPIFVKPANLGSSVGVSKVAVPAELDEAVAEALRYDEWVVIEQAVPGREIECAVLGDLNPVASVPGEVRPSREFYDYEDKYVSGAAELLIPAPLPAEVAKEVQRLAVAAFVALRAEGMARVDFFYDEGGRGLVVNELNTIPGFTPISMYPKLWEATGLPYPELLDRLVELALRRHARRSALYRPVLRGAPPGR